MRKSYHWTRGDRGHWRLCLSSFSGVLGADACPGRTKSVLQTKGHQQPTETSLWEAGLLKRSKEKGAGTPLPWGPEEGKQVRLKIWQRKDGKACLQSRQWGHV